MSRVNVSGGLINESSMIEMKRVVFLSRTSKLASKLELLKSMSAMQMEKTFH